MKKYQVHIPKPAKPALQPGEALVPITDLPEWAQKGFVGVASLNRIQVISTKVPMNVSYDRDEMKHIMKLFRNTTIILPLNLIYI